MSDVKGSEAKGSKRDRKVVGEVLSDVDSRIGRDHSMATVPQQLAREAESSRELSALWSLPPAQLLRFGPQVQLTQVDSDATPGFKGGKKEGQRFIDVSSGEISRYQELLYANGSKGSNRRVLIVLQGMDAAGKGGIVRHVFQQGDPMGIHYHGFGNPSGEELKHDFLWRVRRELPKSGWMAVFDRSHYEDIVMPHVYGTFPQDVWRSRYQQVNDFEQELTASGCAVIKVFLVSSKDAQKRHFLKRLDDPKKFWKFDLSDLDARSRWGDYMQAWQEVFEKTSTTFAPWYLVPADNRWYSRAVVSELLRDTLADMNMTWPPLAVDAATARARLASE